MKKILSLILLIFILFLQRSYAYDKNFNRINENYNVKLEIFDGNKKIADFKVAIANNNEKRSYGLMNLKYLNTKKGMLFIFEKPDIINMWMKNTLISLDMIFIDENNQIVKIAKYTKPQSLDIVSSKRNVNKVLEINAGLTDKYKIKEGQIIKFDYENFKN